MVAGLALACCFSSTGERGASGGVSGGTAGGASSATTSGGTLGTGSSGGALSSAGGATTGSTPGSSGAAGSSGGSGVTGRACATALLPPIEFLDDAGDALCALPDGGALRVNLWTDPNNCGLCGLQCPQVGNQVYQCDEAGPSPYTRYCFYFEGMGTDQAVCPEVLDGSTVLQPVLLNRSDNCGGCGCACPWGQTCANVAPPGTVQLNVAAFPQGACVLEDPANCPDGGQLCPLDGGGSACVDTQRDPANCGRCSFVCCPGEACDQGVCNGPGVPGCP